MNFCLAETSCREGIFERDFLRQVAIAKKGGTRGRKGLQINLKKG